MANRHTPSPSPSPTRDRFAGGRSGRGSPSRSRAGPGLGPAGGDSRSPSPTQDRSSRFGRLDRLRDRSTSQTRSRSRPAPRYRSRSRSSSGSHSRSRSRDRALAQQRSGRLGDEHGRSRRRRSLSSSRSRSSSRSDSRSRSELRRDHEDAKGKARHEEKKEAVVKTSAMFLGAIAVTTLAVCKFWPKGFPYGDKEEWETREIPKNVQKAKEDLLDKRDEVHQKFEGMTHGRRPMLEGRHARSESTTSAGSSGSRRYAEYDRERIHREDRNGRRYLPAAREWEGRAVAEQEIIRVNKVGRRMDPPPRHERTYMRQETRYSGDNAPDADGERRLVTRSREDIEFHQPPARSSKVTLEETSHRARDMPLQKYERRMNQDDTSSRASLKYVEPEVLNPPRYEKVTSREERTILDERTVSPSNEWERDGDLGRERRWKERTKETHQVTAEYDRSAARNLERGNERFPDAPSREVITERRETVRGRDPSPPRDIERPRDRTPSRKVIETQEIVREKPERSWERDSQPNVITVEEQETVRKRDVSSRGHKAARDGQQADEIIVEHEETIRGRAPSPHRDYGDGKDYDRTTKKVVRERREVMRDRSPSPYYEYERTREQPREFREEHRVVRERESSPPRGWERPRERRSNQDALGPIEDDYLDLPTRTRRKNVSPMPSPRRGDRERIREEGVTYY